MELILYYLKRQIHAQKEYHYSIKRQLKMNNEEMQNEMSFIQKHFKNLQNVTYKNHL